MDELVECDTDLVQTWGKQKLKGSSNHEGEQSVQKHRSSGMGKFNLAGTLRHTLMHRTGALYASYHLT